MRETGESEGEVSVIGLGEMGAALAQTLLGGGRRVVVWNRTSAKADPLVRAGAVLAPDAAAAVRASSLVIVCVTDYEATRTILEAEGVASALSGRTLIQLTTGTPQDARNGGAWAQTRGVEYLDGAILAAPSQVGRPDTPIFVSGSEAAFRQSEPILRILAGNLQYRGEAVGAASAWDLAFLSYGFGGIMGFYHGARIMESENIPVDTFGSMMAAISPVIGEFARYEGEAIQTGEFGSPESSLEITWKGMEMIRRHAKEARINAVFPAFAADFFKEGVTAGYGNERPSALIKVLRQSA
ncbi:MAG: NAD(P)-dependent oxidoreductase [Cytophagales bacterium]|nr:NAD(P)-dependent oxidoreductase [Armatimonadota bacterium]